MSLRTRLRPLWALLALPATLAHELAHALASLPWARQLALVVEPGTGRAAVRVDWRDSAGQWARSLAALAPFVAGVFGAVVAIVLWLRGGRPIEPLKYALLAGWWVVFMTPSSSDRDVARGETDG